MSQECNRDLGESFNSTSNPVLHQEIFETLTSFGYLERDQVSEVQIVEKPSSQQRNEKHIR